VFFLLRTLQLDAMACLFDGSYDVQSARMMLFCDNVVCCNLSLSQISIRKKEKETKKERNNY
jgi:hypothetical protein